MTERGRAHAVRSAMTKTPRNPPSSTGAPRPPAAAPRPEEAGPAPGEAPASNPFASLASSSLSEPGGETKLYEVPRELIEIARARAAEPRASKGTLTPIAPRPNAELEASLAAYTAGLAATSGAPVPSSRRPGAEPPPRQELDAEPPRRSFAGPCEESGTVLRRDVARSAEPPPLPPLQSDPMRQSGTLPRGASERLPALEGKPLLRSPVSPSSKPAARPRSTPASTASTAAAPRRPWLLYLGLCLIAAYCVHLLLGS